MKNRTKYCQVSIHLSDQMHNEIRKECFRLRISRQAFIRALVRDHFIRNHGIDVDLQREERIFVKREELK